MDHSLTKQVIINLFINNEYSYVGPTSALCTSEGTVIIYAQYICVTCYMTLYVKLC